MQLSRGTYLKKKDDFISVKTTVKTLAITLVWVWASTPAIADLDARQVINIAHPNVSNSTIANISTNVAKNKRESNNPIFTQSIRFLTAAESIKAAQKHPEYMAPLDRHYGELYQELGFSFHFATIKGKLTGYVDGIKLQNAPVRSRDNIQLRLPNDLSEGLSVALLKMPGLEIDRFGKPVHFARLSTHSKYGCFDDKSKDCQLVTGGAGFLDGNDMSWLTLVYTSSKVEIKGEKELGGKLHNFNIRLPEKGWHWIKAEINSNVYYMSYVTPDSIDPIIVAI